MLREVPAPVANPENGEVALYVRNDRDEIVETFVLRMKTNAVCVLEKAMGAPIHELGARIINPSMQDLRALVFAALNDQHPGMSMTDAGNLIDRAGSDACVAAILEAMKLGFPRAFANAKAAKASEGKGHGTGNGSSRTARRSASVPRSSGS